MTDAALGHDDVRQQVGLTEGNELNMPALMTLAARRPELHKIFNYASLIINTHYFLAKIAQTPSTPMRSFESEIIGRARGMSGPGWIWIAKIGGQPTILATYGSGSILVRDGNYRGKSKPDLIWRPKPSTTTTQEEATIAKGSAPGGITTSTGSVDTAPEPVAVLSMFEATYSGTHGTGPDARARYAQDWYNSLDWRQIRSEMQ